ncbi:SIMPL domain-containing protein [Phenylobacterium sp.]|uniref:SIMPL domain-containing protein n=1 Tax=Phenylobacterium sp. TaxID=1871053 RepID=UPI002D15645F|nr:SIMPL domain-containing protein [Phenylobacterium sp.]HLZ73630.1 SIMPL domain-containing protein [Phenylobacterium sp.]
MKMPLRAGLLALALAAPAPLSAAHAQAAGPSAAESLFHATTLNLSAYGESKLSPDMATISLGVATEGGTAARALSDNAARMNQVLGALKAAGVPQKDIRTSGLNLNAQYAYEQGQAPRLTGYHATDQVTVTVHDLSKVGAIADATVGAGANQVNGVSFGLADPTAAANAAREEAVRALAAKAELYARASGYRVARLVSLSEGGGVEAYRPQAMTVMAQARVQNVPTTVAPGELTVRVDISGLYELTR